MILVKRLFRRSYNKLLNLKLFYWYFCLESGILSWYLNSVDNSFLTIFLKLFAVIQSVISFLFLIIYHTNLVVYGDWRGERKATFIRIHEKLDSLRDDLLFGDKEKELEYWSNLELLADFSEFSSRTSLDNKQDLLTRSF